MTLTMSNTTRRQAGAVALADRDYFSEYRPFNAEELTGDPQFSLDAGTLTGGTADDLAEHARTNAYEVMTALGRRYARVYVDQPESEPENTPETSP